MTTSPTTMDQACRSPIGTVAAQHIAMKLYGLQQLLHLVICFICIFYRLKLITESAPVSWLGVSYTQNKKSH